ncbi:hypothetical protein BGZ83_001255 [Gryganskiella cystojenkinii]|nr:hypothetical protein BGZ83_001255 [Gryganskiella cystojenkinii]
MSVSPSPSPSPLPSSTSVPGPLPSSSPQPPNNVTWVCQESFHADNTTSCLRYPKLKRCVTEGLASNLTFLCVDHDSIAVGGSGPVPLPANITAFMCTLTSCPQEAPAKEPSAKPPKSTSTSAGVKSKSSETVRWAGVLVLTMLVSQMVLTL